MKTGNYRLGTIITMSSPESTEIMSLAGFDWLMIDMEHSTLSLDNTQKHLQAASPGVTTIVRVPVNDETWIKRVLDTGCDGIMVPMVKTAAEAEKAVMSISYPPAGSRSVGISRAHGYGLNFKGYVFEESRELKLLIQIEHIEAVNNLDEILKVKGISGIFIGPYDLSSSMGMMGKVSSPEVTREIDKIKRKCNDAAIPWGIFGMTPGAVEGAIADGGEWILCGIDSVMLSSAASAIVKELGK